MLAARRVVATLRVLERKHLSPATFIVPVALYETADDFAYFKANGGDPVLAVMDWRTWALYADYLVFGLNRKGWRTQLVPIRREDFSGEVEQAEAVQSK